MLRAAAGCRPSAGLRPDGAHQPTDAAQFGEQGAFLSLVMVLHEVLERSFGIEQTDQDARSHACWTCTTQALLGVAQQRLDAPVFGAIDGIRPLPFPERLAARQHMAFLEFDVTQQTCGVLAQQPHGIVPAPLEECDLMVFEHLLEDPVLPFQAAERIGTRPTLRRVLRP